jgi:hypothetical protein
MKTAPIVYHIQRIITANLAAFAPKNQRSQRGNQRRYGGDSVWQGAGFGVGGMHHVSLPAMAQAVGPTYPNGD